MSKKSTLRRQPLLALGAELEAQGVSVAADWRYDLVCDYLKASPSYRAVKRKLEGRVTKELPVDYSTIEQVVLDFGDIYRLWEPEWWKLIGTKLYGIKAPLPRVRIAGELSSSSPTSESTFKGIDSLIVEIPLALTLPAALKQIRKAIEGQRFAALIPEAIAPKYQLAASKLRRETLQTGLMALHYYEKRMPLWQIGNRLELIPAQTFDERALAKEDHHKVSYEKEVLSIAARRLVRTALLVAENAARGRFPSDRPFPEAMTGSYKRKAGRPVGSTSPKRRKAGA